MSVTAPKGFRASGVAAGLKSSGGLDVALVVNEGPLATAAAVFTSNRVKAAPVLWTQQVAAGRTIRAVVLNAGGANACTGPEGLEDTHRTAEHVAMKLGAAGAGQVAVCSTGLIGVRLPMGKLLSGVDSAYKALDPAGGKDAARAIMTTDSKPKMTVVSVDGWSVGGMAKGAGMLAPSLATMLCVITTDAVAGGDVLQEALSGACRVTFDRLDSDGCTSTNDTVLLLASGSSGVEPTQQELTDAVTRVCHDLAQQLLADAEGHTKLISIEVIGAVSEADALEVGRSIARNNREGGAVRQRSELGADPGGGGYGVGGVRGR
jgi:glutamate N-acetyltransferase/amino-acid N-acetyltransferase